ncbi:hypothetical protein GPECTOR_56g350 [Gonium pectorale]|uniref:Ankyrin repeat domain-containing protein n=1 Tax=Gonium pectorale TaxID=33097 RepID=A0A150G607_GONPE|nr:hypothetical protein GPECTOR_56g350 [Gonium pectorale]|eukprot:KXZ45254.1 hypothetical protein GPECTOR_56g350 [Gonium pectorale]
MDEEDASKVWIPAIVDRIARLLPRNEAACSLRVVDKATAAMLRTPEFMTVRLSESVPHHAFKWRWGRPGSMLDLTLARRRELLCLTGASGATANLALAARAYGCPLTKEVAYAAGRADIVHFVLRWDKEPERNFCDSAQIAEGIAEGCDLETLKRWLRGLIVMDADEVFHWEVADKSHQRMVLAAAAGSSTPDWQAKRGYPIHPEHKDAVEPLAKTAGSGNTAAVLFLAERGHQGDNDEGIGLASAWAATQGHLHVLQALHAAGWRLDAQVVSRCAASGGHLHVVAWLVETPGLGAPLDEELFCCAARSGSVELLAWLRERGCPWDGRAVTAAAESGCVAALEWLAEQGCPMPDDGSPYTEAARSADMLTLECLRRLGCPWGPPGRVFTASILSGVPGPHVQQLPHGVLPLLQWLVEAGCPVDWPAAVEKAEAEAKTALRLFSRYYYSEPHNCRYKESKALVAWMLLLAQ